MTRDRHPLTFKPQYQKHFDIGLNVLDFKSLL